MRLFVVFGTLAHLYAYICQSTRGGFYTGKTYIMHCIFQRAGLFIVGQVYFQRTLRESVLLSLFLCIIIIWNSWERGGVRCDGCG